MITLTYLAQFNICDCLTPAYLHDFRRGFFAKKISIQNKIVTTKLESHHSLLSSEMTLPLGDAIVNFSCL